MFDENDNMSQNAPRPPRFQRRILRRIKNGSLRYLESPFINKYGLGKKVYNKLYSAPWGSLYNRWQQLTTREKIALLKASNELSLSSDSMNEFEEIVQKVKKCNHFPDILASLFFKVALNREVLYDVENKFREKGWEALMVDEKIVLLYDLHRLYPYASEEKDRIYDQILCFEQYMPRIVVHETNRLTILQGDFKKVYERFKEQGWRLLSPDERVLVTEGLCHKHRGYCQNLDQTLYEVRYYQSCPDVVSVDAGTHRPDAILKRKDIMYLLRCFKKFFSWNTKSLFMMGIAKN